MRSAGIRKRSEGLPQYIKALALLMINPLTRIFERQGTGEEATRQCPKIRGFLPTQGYHGPRFTFKSSGVVTRVAELIMKEAVLRISGNINENG